MISDLRLPLTGTLGNGICHATGLMVVEVAASRLGSENTEAGDLLPCVFFLNENPNMFIELIAHYIWIKMHFLVQCLDACSCVVVVPLSAANGFKLRRWRACGRNQHPDPP